MFSLRGDLLGKTSAGAVDVEEAEPAEDSAAFVAAPLPPISQSVIAEVLRNPSRVKPLPPERIDAETLWLARCMYSESKRPEEQELVAWVVRNRVETAYRGKKTYRDVVLDGYQFSAFNPSSRKRVYYSNLQVNSRSPGWKNTLYLAYYVRHAAPSLRPFSDKTRHFYSELAMQGEDHPDWVTGIQPVTPNRSHKIDPRRFRFFEGII